MINNIEMTLLDELDLAYIITDSNGFVIYKNHYANKFFNFFDLNLCENDINIIIELNKIFDKFNLSKNMGKRVEYEYSINENKYFFDIKVVETKKILKNDLVYIFIINDVTNFKTEIFANQIYKTIFNNVAATIVVTDKNGIIEMVNPSFTKFTGYTPEEAIGQNPRILNSGYHNDEFFRDLWQTISSGQVWQGKLCDRIKSGKIIWEKSVISPIKDNLGNIVRYVAVKENITKEKLEEDELKAFSYNDFLTGIYNRRKFMYEAEIMIDKARKSKRQLFCLMLDIDNFKNVNDNYGHGFGDVVLIEFAKILKNTLRSNDLIARYGGEEFIAIITNVSYDGAIDIAERIRKNIENHKMNQGDISINITVSIGLSEFSGYCLLNELIARADEALYEAKRTGKNKVCISSNRISLNMNEEDN